MVRAVPDFGRRMHHPPAGYLSRMTEETSKRRPSHMIPMDVFQAILDLEAHARAYLRVYEAPGQYKAHDATADELRDALAQLLLDHGLSDQG